MRARNTKHSTDPVRTCASACMLPHSESATDSRHKPDNCRFAPCIGRGAAPARPILARYVTTQRLRPPSVFVRTTSSAHAPVRSRTCVIEYGAARHCLGNRGSFYRRGCGQVAKLGERPAETRAQSRRPSVSPNPRTLPPCARAHWGGRESRVVLHTRGTVRSVGWFAR